jgi:hypothetical protein
MNKQYLAAALFADGLIDDEMFQKSENSGSVPEWNSLPSTQ